MFVADRSAKKLEVRLRKQRSRDRELQALITADGRPGRPGCHGGHRTCEPLTPLSAQHRSWAGQAAVQHRGCDAPTAGVASRKGKGHKAYAPFTPVVVP